MEQQEMDFKNRNRFRSLGVAIYMLRKQRGLSQEELAKRVGISRSHLSIIESTDRVRPFSVDILFNIADELNVTPAALMEMGHRIVLMDETKG